MKRSSIVSNKSILQGKSIIVGTRIAVSTILDLLAAGCTETEIIKEYPILTKKNIKDTLAFAADRLKRESTYRISFKNEQVVFSAT